MVLPDGVDISSIRTDDLVLKLRSVCLSVLCVQYRKPDCKSILWVIRYRHSTSQGTVSKTNDATEKKSSFALLPQLPARFAGGGWSVVPEMSIG